MDIGTGHEEVSCDEEPYVCDGVHNAILCNMTTCSTLREFMMESEILKQNDSTRKQRRVEDMKRYAFELSPRELLSFHCNSADDCCNGGNCIEQSTLGSFVIAQLAFWGEGIIESDFSKSDFNKSVDQLYVSAKFENGKVKIRGLSD